MNVIAPVHCHNPISRHPNFDRSNCESPNTNRRRNQQSVLQLARHTAQQRDARSIGPKLLTHQRPGRRTQLNCHRRARHRGAIVIDNSNTCRRTLFCRDGTLSLGVQSVQQRTSNASDHNGNSHSRFIDCIRHEHIDRPRSKPRHKSKGPVVYNAFDDMIGLRRTTSDYRYSRSMNPISAGRQHSEFACADGNASISRELMLIVAGAIRCDSRFTGRRV